MKEILTTIIFCSALSAFGQDVTYQTAEKNYHSGQYQTAYQGFQSASSYYDSLHDQPLYILCNLKMAECKMAEGQAEVAVAHTHRTATYAKQYPDAERKLKSQIMKLLGEGYLRLGRNDLALDYLLEEKEVYNETQSLALAICYSNLGIVYWNSGNKSTALSYHEQSLAIKNSILKPSDPQIADAYNNIGLIYLADEYLKAINYLNKALKIYEEAYGSNHPKVANCYSNLAFAYSGQSSHREAIQYLDLVLEIWESNFEGDHPNKAFTISNKGRILEQRGDLNQALIMQQEALNQYLRMYGEKHPEVANCYFLLANIYQKQNKFLAAAENYQASIFANLYTQTSSNLYDIPQLQEYYNADILLSSLQAKAKAMEALHYEKTLKPRDLIHSLDCYTSCDALITIIRQLRLTEADKLRLAAIASDVYDNGIRVAIELSKRTFSKNKYQSLAFNFCERSKSAILLEAINETKAKSFSGIPNQLLVQEDSIKTQISFLKQQLAESTENNDNIKKTLFSYQDAYQQFIADLEQDYPSYYNLKYSQNQTTAVQLSKSLDTNTAAISYFTGQSTIYVFVVTNQGLQITEKRKNDDFIKTVKSFRNSIKYHIFDAYLASSALLYTQLIPKLDRNIKSLIFLPDGILGTIPFEALTQPSNESDYTSLNYLLKSYKISYDYAATLLYERLAKKETSTASGILLTAPISFLQNDLKMPELPGTKEEVKEIRYLFLSTDHKPMVRLENEANENFLKSSDLAQFKYLHFATHGIVNESKPELSRIFLTPDATDDGNLYSGEIYSLGINADLVTLSACETGLGQIAKGEGIVGLSRALMYAGAKNLIVSLWQVSDSSTAELMIDFYRQHLHHSQNPYFSDDLQKAKLNLIASGKFANPYYWAPFILVGK